MFIKKRSAAKYNSERVIFVKFDSEEELDLLFKIALEYECDSISTKSRFEFICKKEQEANVIEALKANGAKHLWEDNK